MTVDNAKISGITACKTFWHYCVQSIKNIMLWIFVLSYYKAFWRFLKMWKGRLLGLRHLKCSWSQNVLNAVISAFCFTCHTCKFHSYFLRNWIQSSALYEWLNSPTLLNFWYTEYSQLLYQLHHWAFGAVGEWAVTYIPGGDFLMSGTRVCATDQGRFFTSKNPEQAPNFEVLLQNRPYFWRFTPEQDPFFTIWSQMPGSNVKIPVAFNFCFLQPDVFTFVLLYMSKCLKLSITWISLS